MALLVDFEEAVVRKILPRLKAPYRQDAQLYVACLTKLHGALTRWDKGKHGLTNYLAQCLHDDVRIGLRFIAEMVDARLLKREVERGPDGKSVGRISATPELVEIYLSGKCPNPIRPVVIGYLPRPAIVRRGIKQDSYKAADAAISGLSFNIDKYILDLFNRFPVEEVDSPLAYKRTQEAAMKLRHYTFFFPYFLDTRGRHYVASTEGVTPQGRDYEKALCLPRFNEPLTERGVLAVIEAADGYSEDDQYRHMDISLRGLAYASQARTPENDGWKGWDSPYCGMATANHLATYYDDPSQPIRAFVPRDGRCSGLQHWSALLRSSAVTGRIGMELEEHPDGMDIYEHVNALWTKCIPEPHQYICIRKSAKKPVMTFAYSATRMSAMKNIVDMWANKEESLDFKTCCTYGSNLFSITEEVLEPLVGGVNWLKKCMKIITDTGVHRITWITPDGFMAVQDYKLKEIKELQVRLSDGKKLKIDIKVDVLDANGNTIPNLSKAKSGIGPNLIHSLDATHLRMAALRLHALGIPAVWVHDSFAVHANYVDVLDRIIKEEFLSLYDRNYLAEVKVYWEKEYGVELPDAPEFGDWDLYSILDCPKFFS